MNKILSTTLCFGLLTLLPVMIFLESVHGLPYFIQGIFLLKNKLSQRPKHKPGNERFWILAMALTLCLWSVKIIVLGNELFPNKEDTNREELLLALLNKNFDFQGPSNMDVELANKLEEANQLEKLKEQLMEARGAELSYVADGLSPSYPNKQACFWKYCV